MVLGPVVSLELIVSRENVVMLLLITHIIFTHVRFLQSFTVLRESYTFLTVSVERFLCFFNQFGYKLIFLEFDE